MSTAITQKILCNFKAEVREIINAALKLGATGRVSSNGHILLSSPNGHTMSVSRNSGAGYTQIAKVKKDFQRLFPDALVTTPNKKETPVPTATAKKTTAPVKKAAAPALVPPIDPVTDLVTIRELLGDPGIYKVVLTPGDAKHLLGMNTKNRQIKAAQVQRIQTIITQGHWVDYSSMIQVDIDGVILDGQHRLHACIAAGMPIAVVLATGQPPEARYVIDTGTRRSLADAFRISGKTDVTRMAAIALLHRKYTDGHRRGSSYASVGRETYDHVSMMEYVEEHPAIELIQGRASALYRQFRPVKASAWGAFCALTAEIDEDDADDFTNQLLTGAGLAADSPILKMRDYVSKIDRRDDRAEKTLAIMIKCWNAWRTGKVIKATHIRIDEIVPMPV